jgi:hypothetical protein
MFASGDVVMLKAFNDQTLYTKDGDATCIIPHDHIHLKPLTTTNDFTCMFLVEHVSGNSYTLRSVSHGDYLTLTRTKGITTCRHIIGLVDNESQATPFTVFFERDHIRLLAPRQLHLACIPFDGQGYFVLGSRSILAETQGLFTLTKVQL